jgi:hypothetical protein
MEAQPGVPNSTLQLNVLLGQMQEYRAVPLNDRLVLAQFGEKVGQRDAHFIEA